MLAEPLEHGGERWIVELVGVVDQNADAAQDIAGTWGGAALTDVDALIKLGVDAVTIATPILRRPSAFAAAHERSNSRPAT